MSAGPPAVLELYQVAAEYRRACEVLADLDIDERTLVETLEGLGGELSIRAGNVGAMVLNLEAAAEMVDKAAKALRERAAGIEARAERVKAWLKWSMETAQVSKIEALDKTFVAQIKKNPPRAVPDDLELVPEEYMRVVPARLEFDANKTRKALMDGQAVPGAHLEQGTRLEMKT